MSAHRSLRAPSRRGFPTCVFLLLVLFSSHPNSSASVYNARPRILVVIVVDQFRGDYLERYHDQFGAGGLRLLMERGANFTNCYYDYTNTHTAPGHATLFTGAYSDGHGILANEWWDPKRKKMVSSVEDETTSIIGVAGHSPGASPRNLLASTLGDEMKLATQGKSKVFAISLKDRAAVLPGGFSADGAYWIDKQSGLFVSSSYYAPVLPGWVQEFNRGKRNEKYLNLKWQDASGNVLRTTGAGENKSSLAFYDAVGPTPFANDYEFEFARELVLNEKLGSGPATDLLAISLSANDILGHEVGPDSPQMEAMALALDRQLEEFFGFLGRQFGLANVWIALSADHGMAPLSEAASRLRIPAPRFDASQLRAQMNVAFAGRFPLSGREVEYVRSVSWPLIFLSEEAFSAAGMKEAEAERAAGELLMSRHPALRGYHTRAQLKEASSSGMGRRGSEAVRYANSYSPYGGWYVMVVPAPFVVASSNPKNATNADHSTGYSYDTHVPLQFFGLPFVAGTYRTHAEPVDMAATLASLLGINAPTHSIGRVLTEALRSPANQPGSGPEGSQNERPRAESPR